MSHRRSRTARSLLAAASAFACALAPQTLAQSQETGSSAAFTTQDADAVIEAAKLYIADGRPLHAREALLSIMESDALSTFPTRTQTELFSLHTTVKRLIDATDPNEISVERAELALESGDIQLGMQHATAVLLASDADADTQARATELIGQLGAKKKDLEPLTDAILARAVEDFRAGRYASARAGFDQLERSGVTLTRSQRRIVESHRGLLMELAESGELKDFDTPIAASVMQAGVVKRRDGGSQDDPDEMEPIDPIEAALSGQDAPATQSGAPGSARVVEEMEDAGSVPVTNTTTYANQPISLPQQPQEQLTPGDFLEPMEELPPNFRDSADAMVQQAMQSEAASALAGADAAFASEQWSQAASQYQWVLSRWTAQLTPAQIQRATDNLATAQVRSGMVQTGAPSAGGVQDSLLSDEVIVRKAQADRARKTFEALMAEARRSLDSGDFGDAQDKASRARLTAAEARDVLRASEFESYDRRVSDFLATLESSRVAKLQADQKTQEQDLARQAREEEEARQHAKEQKILEAIDQVRALQMEQRYDEALQVINSQILFLDPLNPAGLLLRDLLRDARIYTGYARLTKEKGFLMSEQAFENYEASLPTTHMVEYPEDWPTLSATRLGALSFNEAPADRAALAALDRNPVQVAFADNTLADVLAFVGQIASVDMDIDWDSLEEIGVEPESQVSLNLRSAMPKVILERVLDKVSVDPITKADWAVKDGIVQIASQTKLRQDTVIEIYDIRDLIVDIPDYEDAPEIDLQQVLQSGQGGGGQSPFQENDDERDDRLPIEERVTIIEDIIRANIDPDSWLETGSIQVYSNGSLIIRNTPKNHREIRGLLSKLRDVRAMQINVETRFLLVSQDFFEQVGFDLDVYWNANNNQVRSAQAGDPTVLASDFFNFDQTTVTPGSGLGLQRSITGAPAPTGPTTTPQSTELTQGVRSSNGGWSPIGTPQNSLGLAESLFPAEGIASSVLTAAPALGIAGQFLDDIQVDFLIKATQADRRSVTLNAPRLTFTNGQIANIYVVTQQSFVSDLQPIVSDSAVGFDPEVDVVSEGVVMLVEGTISSDRRYVQMNIDAAISTIDDFGSEAVTATAGGQLVSSSSVQSFIQLPIVTVTRVRTTTSVPDQGTVLLGGQRVVSETEVETGVPVLSKIPIINRFFTNRIESRDEQTLMILVKPTILIQGEQEERAFPGLSETLGSYIN